MDVDCAYRNRLHNRACITAHRSGDIIGDESLQPSMVCYEKANKVPEGQKWSDFWSQCSKDYAAKNGADTASEKPAKTAAVSEDDSSGSAQAKKDCDAKWGANKAKTGAHGWHDYFQFMSKCM